MCHRILEFSGRLRQSIAKDILLKLQQGTNPALLGILQPCSVLETIGLIDYTSNMYRQKTPEIKLLDRLT